MAVVSPGLKYGALAAGAAAALGGLVAYGMYRPSGDAPVPETVAAVPAQQSAATAPAEPTETVATAPTGAVTPAPDAPAAAVEAEPQPAAPTFDVVRVEPDGAALVAGRAEPGAQVTISTEAGPVAEATADAKGEFVAVFDAPPADAPQALSLAAEDDEGVTTASPDVVVLLPPAPETAEETAPTTGTEAAPTELAAAEPAPTEAATEEAATVAAAPEAAPAETQAAPAAQEATEVAAAGPAAPALTETATAAAEPEPEPQVAATVVLRGDSAEATPTAAPADGRLTLGSISYGETGLVTLAGFGPSAAPLRAYIDNRFARDGAVGADGRWTLELGDVAAGVYRLRIDALRRDGTVASRVETPFQRDFPTLAAPAAEGAARPASITVQPGNNLWTLAREHYGAGVLYTQIHTANRDLIRDPELIYPGQIFVLPEVAPAQ